MNPLLIFTKRMLTFTRWCLNIGFSLGKFALINTWCEIISKVTRLVTNEQLLSME